MKRRETQIDNLEAFLAEARAVINFKDDLKLIRDEYNLSGRQLARQFGVNHSQVSRWLRGEQEPKCLIRIHLTAEKIRSQRLRN